MTFGIETVSLKMYHSTKFALLLRTVSLSGLYSKIIEQNSEGGGSIFLRNFCTQLARVNGGI
jgi:hypothetical protein